MPIDYGKLRSLTVRALIKALNEDGFSVRKSKGATRFFRHADGRRVTVHFHQSSQTFKLGTLKAIIEEQAQWAEDDLIRLKLLRT